MIELTLTSANKSGALYVNKAHLIAFAILDGSYGRVTQILLTTGKSYDVIESPDDINNLLNPVVTPKTTKKITPKKKVTPFTKKD